MFSDFFVVIFVSYSFKVDHAVVASKFTDHDGTERLASSHRKLTGYLVDPNGNILRTVSSAGGKSDRVRKRRQVRQGEEEEEEASQTG